MNKRINTVIGLLIALLVVVGIGIAFNKPTVNEVALGRGGDFKTASSSVVSNAIGAAAILAPANEGRGWMSITNMTATAAYLALNATSSPNAVPILADTKYTILVPASSTYTFNEDNRYTGQVIATSSAACTFRVTEIY